ncbi:MAG TPA: rod shape-determining protein MreC [Actinomycetes bacterium]|nr:rod shape-determining protein MreC [Actinomycetes bacterium]
MLPADDRRARRVLAVLLAVSFALITLDARNPNSPPVAAMRDVAATVFGPLQEGATTALISPVEAVRARIGNSEPLSAEVERLRTENGALRQQLSTTVVNQAELRELGRLLQVAGAGEYRVVAARVIGIGPAQGLARTITLDAGRTDGLRPEQTVINGDGLVGRVLAVGLQSSTVLLTVDPSVAVGIRMEGSREIGVVTGTGGAVLTLQLLNPQARLYPGDRLVTFGSTAGRPYVPGVPVGSVVSVSRGADGASRTVEVLPYVRFSSLDLVGIVVEQVRRDSREAVLPGRGGELG